MVLSKSKRVARAARLISVVSLTAGACVSGVNAQQVPQPTPYPGYPTTYGQPYPAQDPYMGQGGGPQRARFRDIFAGTLAMVLQTATAGATARISQGVNGAIANWFNRAGANLPSYATNAYGAAVPANNPSPGDPYGLYGTDAPNTAPGSSGAPPALYAGMAYEVHLLGADGQSTAIDPTSYAFASGERFIVYYRPSLPGTVEVYNTNPLGQTTRIDATNIASGQLVTLGPYEFTDTKGDETLRLVMSPCTDTSLLTTTRDIVKVGSPDAPINMSGGVALPACGGIVTRGLKKPKTRDIRKVGVEEGTSYALDQVSQRELTSGQYDSRSVTITFHHR
jgi:hypothetical protein